MTGGAKYRLWAIAILASIPGLAIALLAKPLVLGEGGLALGLAVAVIGPVIVLAGRVKI